MLPAGHMPNPGNQACAVCHTAIGSTLASYATLASVAVLHTGISGNCGQCHGATTQLTFYNNNDNPKAGGADAGAHPVLAGHRLQLLPRAELRRRGLRAHQHERGQACLRAHGLRYLPRSGLELLHGRLDARPAGPAGRSHEPHRYAATADRRLLGLSQHDRLDDQCHARGAHAESGQPDLLGVSYGHQRHAASYATLASIAVLHTGISGNCGQCHGSPSGALTFYNNNDNPKAAVLSPVAHSVSQRHRLQLVPCHELRRGRLRPHQHERGQARVRAHDVRYLP